VTKQSLGGSGQGPGVLPDGAGEMRQREMGRRDAPWELRLERGAEMPPSPRFRTEKR
jgi:hypothetical protein